MYVCVCVCVYIQRWHQLSFRKEQLYYTVNRTTYKLYIISNNYLQKSVMTHHSYNMYCDSVTKL